jgi:hypothetical protein
MDETRDELEQAEPAFCAYVNADDLFYWMDEDTTADIPLRAIWIDMPTGCRFCC